jgi:hypothetical protein
MVLIKFGNGIFYHAKDDLDDLFFKLFKENKEEYKFWLYYLGYIDIFEDYFVWKNIIKVRSFFDLSFFKNITFTMLSINVISRNDSPVTTKDFFKD